MSLCSPEQDGRFRKAAYVILVADDVGDRDLESINRLLHHDATVVVVRDLDHAAAWMAEPETGADGADLVRVGELEIHLGERRVRWRGRRLDFSGQEIEIMAQLARLPGRAVSFAEITENVWGTTAGVHPTVVHCAVHRLRRKLRQAHATVRVESVRGFGLRLVPE